MDTLLTKVFAEIRMERIWIIKKSDTLIRSAETKNAGSVVESSTETISPNSLDKQNFRFWVSWNGLIPNSYVKLLGLSWLINRYSYCTDAAMSTVTPISRCMDERFLFLHILFQFYLCRLPRVHHDLSIMRSWTISLSWVTKAWITWSEYKK